MVAGQPLKLTLQVCDACGNGLTQGGDVVHVDLEGPPNNNVTAAVVEDLSNGTYSIQLVPDCSGRWTLVPRQAMIYKTPRHSMWRLDAWSKAFDIA